MSGKSLEELLVEYLDHMRSRRMSRCTVKQHRCGVRLFLRWLRESCGIAAPERLRPAHLESWLRHVSGSTVRGKPIRPGTINKRIETVKGLLNYLGAKGYIGRHLAESVDYVKEPKVLPGSVLSHAQARRMLESVGTDSSVGYRNRTMLELLYTAGIRAGELVGMDVGHVDFANGVARVTGKGEKQRMVPIGRTALHMLETYVKGVRPFLLARRLVRHSSTSEGGSLGEDGAKDPIEPALFLDERGRRLPYHTLLRLVHACARRCGMPVNVTPHCFRRSCTTELLRGGAGMYHLKELLGHESLDTLDSYVRLNIHDLKKEHQRCHPREKDDCSRP